MPFDFPPITLPLHIDSTMMSAFKSCRRKFYWEFIRGLRPKTLSDDLHAGGVFADALERFYICTYRYDMPLERALAYAVSRMLELWGDHETHPKNPKSLDNMIVALEDYVRKYPPRVDRFQPFIKADGNPSVEFSFAIPLDAPSFPRHPSGDPFIYCGRADALGTYDGILAFKDDKTTKGIGQKWSIQWDLRGQFLGYVWAGQQSGIAVDSVLVRGIGILMTEIKQIEALKTYPQHLVDNWYNALREELTLLRQSWDNGYWNYNFGEACAAYGGCQFNPLCVAKDPEPWTADYNVRFWNPLLKNPISDFVPDTTPLTTASQFKELAHV